MELPRPLPPTERMVVAVIDFRQLGMADPMETPMRLLTTTVLAALLVAGASAAPAMAQDGAALFNAQCKSCHTLTGTNGPAGPSLKGVSGRKIAGSPGYAYSKALSAKGGTWTDGQLDAYLAGPAAFAPGTKMFNKVADPKARAAIVAYLKTQK